MAGGRVFYYAAPTWTAPGVLLLRRPDGSGGPRGSWYDFRDMATPLGPDEVHRIAALAHLALTDDEVVLFGRQLADILDYVRQVQAEDTDGVTPMSHVLDDVTLERADEPAEGLARPSALANAPEAAPEAGLFKVPRVVG